MFYSSVQGKYANGEKFTYTQALVFFLCVANTIFAWVLRPKKDVDTVPTRMYGLCAASYLLAMICSNQALQYLPYPTQVLAKSCKPIPVLIFGVLFAGKKYSWRKYLFILMIVFGVAVFLYKDKKSTTEKQIGIGELLLFVIYQKNTDSFQYFIFKTISEFSPLTCSVITTTRKLFTIIISVVFMNHPLLERQKWATVVVFSGLIMDAVDSKMSKKRPHTS
ncbi:unnamed protein product [Strongylus vulgaris]|uniref:Sugar phosphate transporter domain-containing protein n=1 Tax=Strongylus vulgaris TaxID=40348 RepID=A0A3P7LLS6_STRVU|nr:unnamed protein product [Strongylus vulgaris]